MNVYDAMNLNSKFKLILRELIIRNEVGSRFSASFDFNEFIRRTAKYMSINVKNIIFGATFDNTLSISIENNTCNGSVDEMCSVFTDLFNTSLFNYMQTNEITSIIDEVILKVATTCNFNNNDIVALCNIVKTPALLLNNIKMVNGTLVDKNTYIIRL